MNNRITNKNIHHKSNINNNIKEETKNSAFIPKNTAQVFPTRTILKRKKNIIVTKKQKNNIGINLQKLIINTKRKNNSPSQLDEFNRNLSYNNVILQKKSYNKNNSQSILPKTNTKSGNLSSKNIKNSTNEYYTNNNIIKGKTYFIRNLDLTEEILENSTYSINKLSTNSIVNNYITPKNKKGILILNNKMIFKNNSFINKNSNIISVPQNKIKNCYTNLNININRNDNNNKGKNKYKGIPFSLKKNNQKINTIIENKKTQMDKNDNHQNIYSIYKNDKLLKKKKASGNKVISFKMKNNNDIFLTEKNYKNDNLKKSFCNINNDIINKKMKMSFVMKKGYHNSPNQSFKLSDNKSFKMSTKLDLDEFLKKEPNFSAIDLNNGKNKFNNDIKKNNLCKNMKKNLILINNKLNNKYKNSKKEKNETNNKIIINNTESENNSKILKNESFIYNYSEKLNKIKKENKNNINKSIKNKKNKNKNINNNNNISKSNSESDKFIGDEEIDTIEDSLKDCNNIRDIHVFKTSNISFFKTMQIACVEIESILLFENITEIIFNFCDLKSLNKLCLLSKKIYQYIKPIIYKIIRNKVFNYNKDTNNKYKNKIKSSLFKYSSLSEKSPLLLEKKYKDLLFENINKYDEQIKKDLTRTFPDNSSFHYGNNNYNKLYHVLTAYSNFNKNIGYVQGLNFLAANSIFVFEKEIDVFIFLDSLIQKFKLEDIIGVISNNLNIKLEGITKYLNKYIPKINKYFGKMNLNYEFFIAGWVLTLFSNSMDSQYLFYIWDYMIIFGWDYFNCFVVAVLKKYENEILSIPLNKLTFYMKNILRNESFQNEFENIIKYSFEYLLKEKNIK